MINIDKFIASLIKGNTDGHPIEVQDLLKALDEQGLTYNGENYEIQPKNPASCQVSNNENTQGPRFKPDDWIVRGDIIAQILDIQEQYYVGLDINGKDFTSSRFLNNAKIHLWTINDAKDGDILATKAEVCIFKEISTRTPSAIEVYCTYRLAGNIFIPNAATITNTDFKPADENKKEILFAKLRECGYKWDRDTKSLLPTNAGALEEPEDDNKERCETKIEGGRVLKTLEVNGKDIIITDPCYIVKDGDWHDFLSERPTKVDKIQHYIANTTLYGDWSCTTFDTITKEELGKFCADTGMVGVFLLDEVLKYNPTFDYHTKRPWTTTLIKDFTGTISIIKCHYSGVYTKDSSWFKKGDKWEEDAISVEGIGNINFFTIQTGA